MENNDHLISYCGLYCSACPSYKKRKCKGCERNEKASWCQVRKCNIAAGTRSCADCKTYENAADCAKFNNFTSKAFGFIFNTDRKKGVAFIKNEGYDLYAKTMFDLDRVCFKRSGTN